MLFGVNFVFVDCLLNARGRASPSTRAPRARWRAPTSTGKSATSPSAVTRYGTNRQAAEGVAAHIAPGNVRKFFF